MCWFCYLPASLSGAQIDTLRSRTMRDVLCQNLPELTKAQTNVFLPVGITNQLQSCNDINELNTNLF